MIASVSMPFRAAFSLSTSKTIFLWSASTYQSTSTTSFVFANISFIVAGYLDLPVEIGSVDLRHEGAQHRRSGRYLHDLHPGVPPVRDGLDGRPDPLCDVVALRLPLVLRHEIDLDVRLVARRPHEVVAHEAVEIEGRRRAHVGLVVQHLGHALQIFADLPRSGRRFLEARAFRRIDHYLELALVVEGEHLDPRQFRGDQQHGADEQGKDEEEEAEPLLPAFQEPPEVSLVEPVERAE